MRSKIYFFGGGLFFFPATAKPPNTASLRLLFSFMCGDKHVRLFQWRSEPLGGPNPPWELCQCVGSFCGQTGVEAFSSLYFSSPPSLWYSAFHRKASTFGIAIEPFRAARGQGIGIL